MGHAQSLLKKKHGLATHLTPNHQTNTCYGEPHCFSGDQGRPVLSVESEYPTPLADKVQRSASVDTCIRAFHGDCGLLQGIA